MKLLISSYLVIFAWQFSVSAEKQVPNYVYNGFLIDVIYKFPINSYWIATKSNAALSIQYIKNIPSNSSIRLDYTLQYLDKGLFVDTWKLIGDHGSVFLCNKTRSSQDDNIVALVRNLFGIFEKCPVSSGDVVNPEVSNTSVLKLYFNRRMDLKDIRILMNVWSQDQTPAQHLFEGEFLLRDILAITDARSREPKVLLA